VSEPAASYGALFRAPYRALMVAALGATFLGSLDALMVSTALPTAAQDIGGVGLIALTFGLTMVTISMTFPLAGSVIDRWGVPTAFAIACSVFALANVIGGLAPSMPVIAVSRAVLGVGAGFMFSVPLALFAVSVPDALRPRAFGINAAMWGVSAIVGPALGAVLTATVGWRFVFWVNLPMIAIVAWAGAIALRGRQRPPVAADPPPINLIGPVLLGAVAAVLLAITVPRPPLLAIAPFALVPALLFLVHERRAGEPVFLHARGALAANVASFAAGAAFLGAETYLPLELQVGFGRGVVVVGLALVLCTAGWTLGSMGAARVDLSVRRQITLGTGLVFVSTLAMAVPAGGIVTPIVAYMFSGLGMGVASPALFAAVLAGGEVGREGRATASVPLARQVGAGMGTAVAGIVFAASLTGAQLSASQHSGSHVGAVVPAARLTFLAVAVFGGLGLLACRWLDGDRRPEAVDGALPAEQAAA